MDILYYFEFLKLVTTIKNNFSNTSKIKEKLISSFKHTKEARTCMLE